MGLNQGTFGYDSFVYVCLEYFKKTYMLKDIKINKLYKFYFILISSQNI